MMAIGTRIYVEIKAHASRCFTDYPFCYKIKVAISRFWRDGDDGRSLAYPGNEGAFRNRHRTTRQAHFRTRTPGKATAGALRTLRKSASSPRFRPNSLGSAFRASCETDPSRR